MNTPDFVLILMTLGSNKEDSVTKRLIVALATASATLLAAVICLYFNTWAQSFIGPIVIIPGGKLNMVVSETKQWTECVIGTALFGLLVSMLCVYGKSPWRRILFLLMVGTAWGCVSWFAGVLVAVSLIWGVGFGLYAQDLFPEGELRKQNGRLAAEASLTLAVGAGIGIGLKYSMLEGLFSILAGLIAFAILAIVYAIARNNLPSIVTGRQTSTEGA